MDRERIYRLSLEHSLIIEGILRVSDEVQEDLRVRNYGYARRGLTLLSVIGVNYSPAKDFAASRLVQIKELLRLHSSIEPHSEWANSLIGDFFAPHID